MTHDLNTDYWHQLELLPAPRLILTLRCDFDGARGECLVSRTLTGSDEDFPLELGHLATLHFPWRDRELIDALAEAIYSAREHLMPF